MHGLKRMSKQNMSKLLSVFIILMLLTGCSGWFSVQPSGDEIELEQERIKLTLWHNWVGQDGKAIAMRGILDQFRSEHPEVLLEDEGMPTDGLKTRLRTVAAADEMPDLFVMFPNVMTREFVAGDLIQPIDDFLNSRPEWKSGFITGALEPFTVWGKTYSVPMNLAPTSLIYYNQALFDRYDLEPPHTWEQLVTAIATFNEHKMIPIALGNKANWVVQSTIFSALADRITGTEWFRAAVAQDGASFTDPIFIEALEKMQELAALRPFQHGYDRIDENQMAQLYFEEKAAMFINGGWALSNIVQNAPQHVLANTHITIIPVVEGGKGLPNSTSGVVGTGMGISKTLSGARLEAALELMYALSGPEGQQATLESSTLVSYQVNPDMLSSAHPLFIELYELMQRTRLSPVYDNELSAEATIAINAGLEDLLRGADPEEIARRVQQAQATAMRRNQP